MYFNSEFAQLAFVFMLDLCWLQGAWMHQVYLHKQISQREPKKKCKILFKLK